MLTVIYNLQKDRLIKFVYIMFFLIGAVIIWASQAQFFVFGWYFLGQVFGIWALTALAFQPLLGSRIPLLEKGVGLDRILKLHSLNGKLLFLFVVLHPLCLFIPVLIGGMSVSQLLAVFTIYHWMGVVALGLIIFIIVTSIYSTMIHLNYEVWKVLHKVGYAVIILGFLHSFYLGSDIVSKGPVFYWWVVLGLIALVGISYRYVIKTWIFKNSWYKIISVIEETHDVTTVMLEPVFGNVFRFFPGQFAYINFHSQKVPVEEHHFTISSAPNPNYISFSIKSSGDFTALLKNLKVGEKAKVEGPYGAFSNQGMDGKFLFIAGGIGITPIISMLKTMQEKKLTQQGILIYANKSMQDVAFKEELDLMQKQNLVKIVYVFSDQGKRVDEDILEKEVEDIKSYKVFLVGPPPMMEAVQKTLEDLGVESKNILSEKFSLK